MAGTFDEIGILINMTNKFPDVVDDFFINKMETLVHLPTEHTSSLWAEPRVVAVKSLPEQDPG